MERDGRIRYAFQVPLAQEPLAGTGANVWGQAAGEVYGRADPTQALHTFDPGGSQPAEATAAAVRQHVLGWVSWAVADAFRKSCTRGSLKEWLPEGAEAAEQVRAELASRFTSWGCQVEGVIIRLELAPDCLQALPSAVRAAASQAASASASGAAPVAGLRTVDHRFAGDIPPVQDPVTGNHMRVRCQVSVQFQADMEQARRSVDPSGTSSEERVLREAVARAEEWFWYGVKQSFYNWICDPNRPHRRFVRDYSLIHPEVLALCQEGLAGLGVTVAAAQVRYETQDPDSAWALAAPRQSGRRPVVGAETAPAAPGAPPAGVPSQSAARSGSSGPPADPAMRADSDQAMAATIAIMNVEDLPAVVRGGVGGDAARAASEAPPAASGSALPPIEEAVWRHQKQVLGEQPGVVREELVARVLDRLRADGYSLAERRRIAGVIGGDPEAIIE